LFERVAAIARGGATSRLDATSAMVPERVERPGIYNRRLPQNYPMAV
jgi:hypothetical protein